MKHAVLSGTIEEQSCDVVAVGLWSAGWEQDERLLALDAALGGKLIELLQSEEFEAKAGKSRTLDTLGALNSKRILIWGLGEKDAVQLKGLRDFAHAAVQTVNQSKG